MLVAGVLCIVVNTVVDSLGSTYRNTYVSTILHIVVLFMRWSRPFVCIKLNVDNVINLFRNIGMNMK
jgi:hypothetical protein